MPQKPYRHKSSSHDDIVRIVRDYREEAKEARQTRMKRNKMNWDMYFANQDWSHKQEGQSQEFLPKVSAAAEQMSAFVKRALVQFGDWFSMELPSDAFLTPEQARALLRQFLENIALNRTEIGSFYTLMSDAVKQGLMESLIILKVHGQYMPTKSYRAEPGNPLLGIEPKLVTNDATLWRLRIDLIPTEDYYPDPTRRGLYEIHRVERDYFDVLESAEQGLYDKKMVQQIDYDYEKYEEDRRKERHRGQDEYTPVRGRRKVCIDECWGTLLGPDGRPIKKDVVVAVANDRYLIRPPEPISEVFWDGKCPIVATPVLRVPHSKWHKALYDDAVSLNLAINELANLILDGGMATVWGVRQVRAHLLQDPSVISNGIPANATLVLNEDAPADAKVVEAVTTSEGAPADAMNVLNLFDREFQAAVKTNDLRLGFLPPRTVKATEVMATEQSGAVVIDGFASDIEVDLMARVLEKSWFRILQFADDIPSHDVVKALGVDNTFKLSRMHPAERFAALGQGLGFKVMGLTSTLSRARDFQKMMSLMQAVAVNPALLEAFMRKASADKMLSTLMRALNINPESMELSAEEQKDLPNKMARMMTMAQMMIPGGGGSQPAPEGASMQAELNQGANPTG